MGETRLSVKAKGRSVKKRPDRIYRRDIMRSAVISKRQKMCRGLNRLTDYGLLHQKDEIRQGRPPPDVL